MPIEDRIEDLTAAINNLTAVLINSTNNKGAGGKIIDVAPESDGQTDIEDAIKDAEKPKRARRTKAQIEAEKAKKEAEELDEELDEEHADVEDSKPKTKQHTAEDCLKLAKEKVATLGTSIRVDIRDITRKLGGSKISELDDEALNKFYALVDRL